jgi:hypothetical protein
MKIFIVLFLTFFSMSLIFGVEENDFKGMLTVDNLSYRASFELIKKRNGKHLLKIQPKSSKSFCYYKVKRITAPQQMKGRSGIVFSNKIKNCSYSIPIKKQSLFWNDLVLIDMNYTLNSDMSLEGKVKLSSKKRGFRGILEFITRK